MKKYMTFSVIFLALLWMWTGQKGKEGSPAMEGDFPALPQTAAVFLKKSPPGAAPQLRKREAALQRSLLQKTAELKRKVVEAGLDPQELNNRYNTLSLNAFYASLPEKIREGYKDLHAEIRELQDVNLAEDGISREFFRQAPEIVAPDWMVQHAIYLEKQSLSGEVTKFVARKMRAGTIEDSDIQELAGRCKGSWLCIEKAAYLWIKANHQFSEEQFRLLSRYQRST